MVFLDHHLCGKTPFPVFVRVRTDLGSETFTLTQSDRLNSKSVTEPLNLELHCTV